MTTILGVCVALVVIIIIAYIAVHDIRRRERDRMKK